MAGAKLGVSMLYCLGEPFEEMTKHLMEANTEYVEIVDDGFHTLDSQRVETLRDIAKSHNLKYSLHAPFAGINLAVPSKPLLETTLSILKRSIIHASELACHMWVFHPGMKTGISMFYPGMDWTKNLESIRDLANFARDCGVRVGIENVMDPFLMRTVEDYRRFYREVDEDVGLVLDTGHANINGQVEDFLVEFSTRIVHVHAHDNFGKTDQHLGIADGNIDWKKVAELLERASYDKVVVIESVEHVDESLRKLAGLLQA
jgi:sugar phosphate isomerase/epimerase